MIALTVGSCARVGIWRAYATSSPVSRDSQVTDAIQKNLIGYERYEEEPPAGEANAETSLK